MDIPEELRSELQKRVLDVTNVPRQRLRRTVSLMFDEDGLNLYYRADITNSAHFGDRDRSFRLNVTGRSSVVVRWI